MDKLDVWLEEHAKLLKPEGMVQNQKCKKYICNECKDTGWIIFYDDGREVMKRCNCYPVKQAKELLARSGLSVEFCKKGFGNFFTKGHSVLENAKNIALNYVQDFRKIRHDRCNSVMFCGQPGSGKTHLGTAICNSLVGMGIPVMYMPYRNAMTKLKQNITDEAEYSKEISKYMDTAVLYIDDMLKGRLTETDVNVMYEIVNYRYMNNLPLIISTEKNLDELLVFDEATGSRIIEMCIGNIIYLEGKELNYRLD